jgi:iron complex transport system substrate-binding protein
MSRRLLLKILPGLITILILSGSGCDHKTERPSGSAARIVSFSPNITEIIYALGQEDKLIAVTDYCIYPPQAQQKEKIGGLLNPNMEKLLSLQPDLLIGTPAISELVVKVQTHSIRAVMLANETTPDIISAIDSIGGLLNCERQADSLRKSISDSLRHYQNLCDLLPDWRPSAMLVIGRDAGTARNVTVCGRETFISALWELAGGVNIFSDLPGRYAQANREAALTRAPQLIIEFRFNEDLPAGKTERLRGEWAELSGIPAVDHGQIYFLTGNYTLIPGPRIHLLLRDFYLVMQAYHASRKMVSGENNHR